MSDTRTETGTIDLRAALDEANRRASSAEAELGTARGQVGELRGQVRNETDRALLAQETAVDNAITAASTEVDTAEGRWAALQQEGNFTDAAKEMRRMTEATARLENLKQQKQYYAGQREQLKQQPAQQGPVYDDRVKAWIDRNPRFNSDPAFKAEVLKSHHAALAAGMAEFSPEYFDHVERKVYPDRYAAQTTEQPAAAQTRQAAAAADGAQTAATDTEIDTSQIDPNSPAGDGVDFIIDDDRHTRRADPVSNTVHPSEMRSQPENPQRRAAGNGTSISSVAAPPSRTVAEAARRVSGPGPVRLTSEEMEYASSLAESLEPELARRGPAEIAKWYATLRDSPMAERRRAKWYGPEAR